jgi:hypothetical protein
VIGESPSSPSLRLRLRIWMISSVPRVTGLAVAGAVLEDDRAGRL